ncbi:MAG: hypothetical protein IT307_01385 [Chloroflexi bacterium]|nr:hypothetical protein [Chloroflexota bacterium]
MAERTRVWNGRILDGTDATHEAFVDWLRSGEGQRLLSRTLLSAYRLARDGGRITVTLSAMEPTSIIKFLRDPRVWTGAWEFVSADPEESIADTAPALVSWRRPPVEVSS